MIRSIRQNVSTVVKPAGDMLTPSRGQPAISLSNTSDDSAKDGEVGGTHEGGTDDGGRNLHQEWIQKRRVLGAPEPSCPSYRLPETSYGHGWEHPPCTPLDRLTDVEQPRGSEQQDENDANKFSGRVSIWVMIVMRNGRIGRHAWLSSWELSPKPECGH
jgi:hypothetical protein